MDDRIAIREGESGIQEQSSMEPKNNEASCVSQASMSVTTHEKSRLTLQQRPVGLTITVEKIDRVLTDVQAQIENLRQYRINLGLVRVQLAGMEAK